MQDNTVSIQDATVSEEKQVAVTRETLEKLDLDESETGATDNIAFTEVIDSKASTKDRLAFIAQRGKHAMVRCADGRARTVAEEVGNFQRQTHCTNEQALEFVERLIHPPKPNPKMIAWLERRLVHLHKERRLCDQQRHEERKIAKRHRPRHQTRLEK